MNKATLRLWYDNYAGAAANALLDNQGNHAFHLAIGFKETERVVFFRKELT